MKTSPENQPTKHADKKTRNVVLLSSALAAVALLFMAPLAQKHKATTGTADLADSSIVVTEDVENPDEKRPDSSQEYTVASSEPRRIIIDDISVDAFIQKVGINKHNAVSAPTNVHVAGWFVNSEKPGEPGLSIIDAHVSGKYTDGAFKNLAKLQAGDTFSIERGDKTLVSFEVVETKTLPESDSAVYLFSRDETILSQLNLVTCGGTFNKQTQSYSDRTIVIAKKL